MDKGFPKNDINRGPFKNINRILNLANGDYLYGVGDDDYSSPTTIEDFTETLKNWPCIDLISGQIQVDPEGNQICVEKVIHWNDISFHSPEDCLENYFLKEPALSFIKHFIFD